MSYNFYSLAENRVVSLKKNSNHRSDSPKDDALYNRHDRSLFLSNPVTGEHIRLPPVETLGSFFEHEKKYCIVERVILSSPPHQQDCRAIIFFDSYYSRLMAVCSPGRSSAWTTAPGWVFGSHEDAVYSPTYKRFFCLLVNESTSYDLTGWDVTDPSSPRDHDDIREWDMTFLYPDTVYPKNRCHSNRSKLDEKLIQLYGSLRLRHVVHVEHTGQLWYVKRYFVEHTTAPGALDSNDHDLFYLHKTVDFLVYVVDPCEMDSRNDRRRNLRYKEDSLDGMALFVGLNHSFALWAADYPELKPDCIYFTDTQRMPDDYVYGGHDIGIFDYKTKTVSRCYYPCDIGSIKKICPTPMWFTPSPH